MITATQIADWASTGAAQRDLPRLIRRLIHATATTTQIAMPAGDSTSMPGLDGELFSEAGNAWVPAGHSCWEVSCRGDASTKANEDYSKRTGEIESAMRRTRIYVSITARKWSQKSKWLAEKRAANEWLDVRAYDADDLEQWIEQSPAVALAFGEELGLTGHGVSSLASHYLAWSSQCSPAISASAVLIGRDQQAARILERCRSIESETGPLTLPIKSDSVEEAVAFVEAAILTDSGLADRSVVVTDATGWQFVERNIDIVVAIASRPEIAETPSTRNGLVLIVPYASGDMSRQFSGLAGRLENPESPLDRADHSEFEKALQIIGMDENDSRRLSAQCGRSWSIFRRQHAINPAIRQPVWLDHPSSPALATVCLVGAWSSGKEGDKEAVARIAGRSYDDLERDLLVLERLDDSPILKIGTVWKAKSSLELLALFGPRITESEFKRFFDEAKTNLSTPAPELELEKDKRYAAAIYGKVRPISGLLLESFCDTLIKLAVRGVEVPELAALHIDGRVDALVHELLHDADDTRWLSLAGSLPALAEASPTVFLNSIEHSLGLPNAPLKRLFTETDSSSSLGGRCWHAGMLWALEVLGWAPNHLTRVSSVLARLSEVPIAGNWGNSPINSLHGFFRSWFPQTGATIDRRIAVLDILVERHPEAASKLLEALTKAYQGVASHSVRPKWRDDDAGAGYGVANGERQQMVFAATQRQINLARGNVFRISSLVERYASFDDEQRKEVLALLKDVGNLGDAEKEIVRDSLRQKIHWHRNHDQQDKIDEFLQPLEASYALLKPSDLIVEHAWLFKDGMTYLPIRYRDDGYEGRQKLSNKFCVEALASIFKHEGWLGAVKLANASSGGWLIGWHLFDAGIELVDALAWIVADAGDLERGTQLTSLAASILSSAIQRHGYEVLSRCLASADEHGRALEWKIRLLTLAPEGKATWDIVAALGAEACEAYWQNCSGNIWQRDDAAVQQYGLSQLVKAGRSTTAFISCHASFEGIEPQLVFEMLEGVLQGQEKGKALPSSYYFQHAIDYLEKDPPVERMRLAQLEFGLIKTLGFEGEHHAVSLYTLLMSQPEVFMELLCLVYRPRNSEAEPDGASNQHGIENAWSVLHACKRQPGTLEDGTVTVTSTRDFVTKAREMALEKDRLEACDSTLGQILAHAPKGLDGFFPSEPAREVLELVGTEEILNGFTTGCFNKRGVTSRGMLDGGGQERALAEQYRSNAKALEISHPRLSASLEYLAKSYDRHGLAEDLDVRLRREG
jgi:hypothetical protein